MKDQKMCELVIASKNDIYSLKIVNWTSKMYVHTIYTYVSTYSCS